MIFCLKHFFLIYIFIPQDGRIVLSPWKRGAGAPGGRVENPRGDSAAVVAGLGGCHLIKPCLLYVRPSQIPPLGRAVEPPPPGVQLVRRHPWGAVSLLQEKCWFCRGRRGRGW